MASNKKYWKSVEELKENSSIVEKLKQTEFVEEIPTDQFLGDKEALESSSTSRRDFLKYVGFSTAVASLAACEGPVINSIPYLVKPDEVTPGVADYYATTMADGYDFANVLVKVREGRPIKIEPNKDSKEGSANARDNTKEKWKDNSVSWVNDKTDKDIYLKMEDPKGSVRIAFKNEMDFSLENQYLARTLKDILQLRLTETLREQEGGTYGAGVYSSLNRRPKEEVSVAVSFDCNPDKVEKLVAIVYQEIDKIKSGEIQQVDLDKTLTNYLKELEEAKDKNSYELNLIYAYFIDGYNKNDPKNSVDIVNKITAADIQDFTKRLMKNTKSYEIVFKPKK